MGSQRESHLIIAIDENFGLGDSVIGDAGTAEVGARQSAERSINRSCRSDARQSQCKNKSSQFCNVLHGIFPHLLIKTAGCLGTQLLILISPGLLFDLKPI